MEARAVRPRAGWGTRRRPCSGTGNGNWQSASSWSPLRIRKNVWFTANQNEPLLRLHGRAGRRSPGPVRVCVRARRLISTAIPRTITESRKEPPRRPEAAHDLRPNGGPRIASVRVNGRPVAADAPDRVVLRYDELPMQAQVEIVTAGAWPLAREDENAVFFGPDPQVPAELPALPDVLAAPQKVLQGMHEKLADRTDAEYEKAFLSEALATFPNRKRAALNAAAATGAEPGNRSGVMALVSGCGHQSVHGIRDLMERYRPARIEGKGNRPGVSGSEGRSEPRGPGARNRAAPGTVSGCPPSPAEVPEQEQPSCRAPQCHSAIAVDVHHLEIDAGAGSIRDLAEIHQPS